MPTDDEVLEKLSQFEDSLKETSIFFELLNWYQSHKITSEQRLLIRETISKHAYHLTGGAKMWQHLRENEPEKFVRMAVTSISVRDAQPDFRDDVMMLKFLEEYCQTHRITLAPIVAEIQKISSQEVARLFEKYVKLQ